MTVKYELQNIISGDGHVRHGENIQTITSFLKGKKEAVSKLKETKFSKDEERKVLEQINFIKQHRSPRYHATKTHMENRKKIQWLKDTLSNNKEIEIKQFDIEDVCDLNLEKQLKKLREFDFVEGSLDIVEVQKSLIDFFSQINGFDMQWENSNTFESSAHFYGLNKIIDDHFTGSWEEAMWFDDEEIMDKELKIEIQHCIPFDWYNGGSGQAACLHIKDNVLTDEVWRYDMYLEEKVYPMGLNVQEYFDLLIECRGFGGWQDASQFASSQERDKFSECFPKLFPDVDMGALLKKFSPD